jgi:FAD dependent oxidoreductase TIGR03364
MMRKKAFVIGAGIVGLATARALGKKGYNVTVFEKNSFAAGASIRNFGMVWPIGQPDGMAYETAIRSRHIWKSVCEESGIWYDPSGSIHLAYSDLELEVLEDFCMKSGITRKYEMLGAGELYERYPVIVPAGLKGGLLSNDELIVDPPLALRLLPKYLEEKYDVKFCWDKQVQSVESGTVICGKNKVCADEIYICTGPDFKNLFPDEYVNQPIILCKLQMMRLGIQPAGWKLGPSLCGGLSLAHYASFRAAGDSLHRLKNHFHHEMKDYEDHGIHVMVTQNASGELIVGDSHHYAQTHDPFDSAYINDLILLYLKRFLKPGNDLVTASWNGIYPKLMDGRTELVLEVQPGVTIINALGGAGMTLSFGLAERIVDGDYTF